MTGRSAGPKAPFSDRNFRYIVIAPAILILLLIGIFPLVYSLVVSFQSIDMFFQDTSFSGGKYYAQLFSDARLWESLSGVFFFDAGNVWNSPDEFEFDLFRSIGIGARYNSPVGPLRFDLGFPLDRRPSDDDFQLYVGFGSVF